METGTGRFLVLSSRIEGQERCALAWSMGYHRRVRTRTPWAGCLKFIHISSADLPRSFVPSVAASSSHATIPTIQAACPSCDLDVRPILFGTAIDCDCI